jgi:hypothetical protein
LLCGKAIYMPHSKNLNGRLHGPSMGKQKTPSPAGRKDFSAGIRARKIRPISAPQSSHLMVKKATITKYRPLHT